ncbi:MAG: SCP2 sterol-binding domain-containing protein, partial [Granulosicoccaceae bacterium]
MHIPIPIAALVQKAISQTLPLDPDTQRALGTIDNKVIAIHVQQPPLEFALSIVDRDIQLLRVFDGEPDVTLAGPLSDFFAMQSSDTVIGTSHKQGRIKITGDEQLAR